ncbi:MAG: hypothetical protein RMK84_05150 [Oscillochloridaceae bacterium]|nr:hypothetical protein [Chloroflexaceae bacterium]MDW8389489.1 hypothetical protein [Oscillochloridaceae bacterium]
MNEFARGRLEQLEDKVRQLERKLDLALKQLKIDVPDAALARVQELIRQGKNAEAVQCWLIWHIVT